MANTIWKGQRRQNHITKRLDQTHIFGEQQSSRRWPTELPLGNSVDMSRLVVAELLGRGSQLPSVSLFLSIEALGVIESVVDVGRVLSPGGVCRWGHSIRV